MAIEKKGKSIKKNFDNYKLYLDDLEEIVRLFSDLKKKDEKLIIETREETVDDVAELKQSSPDALTSIDIYFKESEFGFRSNFDRELTMGSYGASLLISDNNSISTGCAVGIHSVFSRNNIYWKRILNRLSWLFYIIFIASYLTYFLLPKESDSKNIFLLISAALLVSAIITWFSAMKTKSNIVIPLYRKERTSFWKRNKDSIIIGLALLVAGVVLGKIFS